MREWLKPVFESLSEGYGHVARVVSPVYGLPPARIHIQLTSRCNLACPWCCVRTGLNQAEPNRLNLDEWAQVVRSLPRITLVSLMGGEPFVSTDAIPLLGLLLDKGQWVTVVTNGTALSEDKLTFLVERRLSYLAFSIHGLAECHDRNMGKPRAFERATTALRQLRDLKRQRRARFPIVSVKATITPDNHADFPALLELLEQDLGVEEVNFSLLYDNPMQFALETTADLDDPRLFQGNSYQYPLECQADVRAGLERILRYRQSSRMAIRFTQGFDDTNVPWDYVNSPSSYGVARCNKPWTEFALFGDGTVSPCISVHVGNIRDMDYDVGRVLSHPRFQDFREVFRQRAGFFPTCEGCCGLKHVRKPVTVATE